MPEDYNTDYGWTPPSMDEFRQLKKREEEVRQQGEKRNKQANLIGLLTSLMGSFGSPQGAQTARQGAQQGVDYVKQENEMKMMGLKEEFVNKIQLRQLDMAERKFKMFMDAEERARKNEMKAEEFNQEMADRYQDMLDKKYENEMKYTTGERKRMVGWVNQISTRVGDIPLVGESVKKVGEHFAGKIEEFIPKAEKVREEMPGMQALLKSGGKAGPEELEAARRILGIKPQDEREAYESGKEYSDIQMETARINNTIAKNATKFAAVDPNYKINVESYANQIEAGIVKPEDVPEQYRNDANALAILNKREFNLRGQRAGGGGGAKPPEMKQYKSWLDFMGDSKISTNDKQDFLSIPQEAFRTGNEQNMRDFLQMYSYQPEPFIRETLDRAYSDASRPMTEAGAASKLRTMGFIYEKDEGMIYDPQGNPWGTMDSYMFSEGYSKGTDIKGNVQYVPAPNTLLDTYAANKKQFIEYYTKGAEMPKPPTKTEKAVEPKTPIQKKVAESKEKTALNLVSTEANDFLSELKMEAWGLNERSILQQIETPEGLAELKGIIVQESGAPYDDDTFKKIIAEIKRVATNRLRRLEGAFTG